MSDSAEIWNTCPESGESVSLYAQWGFLSVEDALFTFLRKRTRWDDFNYFCRMVFCQLLILSPSIIEGLCVAFHCHYPIVPSSEHLYTILYKEK